jgi:hypothetical protein
VQSDKDDVAPKTLTDAATNKGKANNEIFTYFKPLDAQRS